MEMGDEELSDDGAFVRQRRNLIVSSLVLWFAEATELSLKKLSVFGNEIELDKPESVTLALWVATIYWLIRFYQYACTQRGGDIENGLLARIIQIGSPTALKICNRDGMRLLIEAEASSPLGAELTASTPPKFDFYPVTWNRVSHNALSVICQAMPAVGGGLVRNVTIRVEGRDLMSLRLRAWGYITLHTPLFTELILPYIVFLLPVGYWALKHFV